MLILAIWTSSWASHSFVTIPISSYHFSGISSRHNKCVLNILWLAWFPSPTTGGCLGLQKMDSIGSLFLVTASPHCSHPHSLQKVSTALGFHINPKAFLFQLSIHVFFPSVPPFTPRILPVLAPSPATKSSPLPLPMGGTYLSLMQPSLLLSLSRSVDCTVMILYSTAYIHLQ